MTAQTATIDQKSNWSRRLQDLHRITYVDVVLWALRIGLLVIVVGGTKIGRAHV